MTRFGVLSAALAVLRQAWLPVLLIALWWVASAGSTSFFFPPLSDVLAVLWRDLADGTLVAAAATSLVNVFAGLGIAVVLGIGLGLAIGMNPFLRAGLMPLLDFVRSVPGVALVPIIIVAFGVGRLPNIFLISQACIWAVLLNTIDGVRGTKESILDTARAYRLPLPLLVFRVLLPAAMPQIMAGIRIALSVSLTLMVVGEFFSGNSGIGFYVFGASERFLPHETWAGTILIALLGYLMNLGFLAVERRVLSWYFHNPRHSRRKVRPAAPAPAAPANVAPQTR